MRSHPGPRPPETTDELLHLLQRARLLDDTQLRRLRGVWDGAAPAAPRVGELVQAGLLTTYQAEQALAGRPGRLRLGPYRLLARLGSGGAGRVFKAEHLLLRRLVALKLPARRRPVEQRSAPPTDRSGRVTPGRDRVRKPTQLRREIETVGRLSHPHIVTAHDACRLRGRLVLVLEYVDGVDLERLLAETGPLPIDLACEVVRQAALALDHLHTQGLVHRDVKPANLMLAREGPGAGRPLVKLLDLGLTCRAGRHGESLAGTPDYLAPESGLAEEYCDIRGDLYSLGCTFYQLLSGRVPFPGGGWTNKLLRHRLEEPAALESLRPATPPAVVALVARLMARDPEQRLATPAALLAELDRLQAPLPVPPRRPARLPLGRLAAAISVVVLAGLLLGGMARLVWSDPDPAPAPPVRHTAAYPLLAAALPAAPGYGVVGRADEYATLAAAVVAASDGETILLPDGLVELPSLVVAGKRLTLRATAGSRPILQRVQRDDWDALLHADRDLTLEGIELRDAADDGPPAPLVSVSGGRLLLRRCSLEQHGTAPAVLVRRGAGLLLEDCTIQARAQAAAVQPPEGSPCLVELRRGRVRVAEAGGAALLLWGTDTDRPGAVTVALEGGEIEAGRILALRGVAGRVEVNASACGLTFRTALVSLDGYPDESDWRSVLGWRGSAVRYRPGSGWLRLKGQTVIRSEGEWLLASASGRAAEAL